MRVVVVDVAASSGGALTVLQGFARDAASFPEHEWTFLLSSANIPGEDNQVVEKFAWVKRSWIHRLWFELVVGPLVVWRLDPDAILSLQNLRVIFAKQPQTVYVHQSLPFANHQFHFSKHPKLWVYQKIIGRLIVWSARGSRKVVVQSEWMKRVLALKADIDDSRISVVPPRMTAPAVGTRMYRDCIRSRQRFFYPANAEVYKNHRVIIEAARILETRGAQFRVTLTVTETELAALGTSELPSSIEAVGRITREDVVELYTQSVLIFPSLIESAPLPLYEARSMGSIILAGAVDMYEEVVDDYPNAFSFDPSSAQALADVMWRCIHGQLKYEEPLGGDSSREFGGFSEVLRLVTED